MGNDTRHMIQIENSIYDEIKEFCDLNDLKINVFINEIIQKGFMIEKYGNTPFTSYAIPEKENDDMIIIDGMYFSKENLANLVRETSKVNEKDLPKKVTVESSIEGLEYFEKTGTVPSQEELEEFLESPIVTGNITHPIEPIISSKEVETKQEVKKTTKRRLK